MGKQISKKQLLNSPWKNETIRIAKQSLLSLMEQENRVLFSTMSEEQQEELILQMAYEDHVIELKEPNGGTARAN